MNKLSIQKKLSPKSVRKNGFTLVELLFACAILGFMLTITLVTFIGVFRFYNWSKTTRTTQEASRQVLNTMTREIQSRQIGTISAGGTSLCLNASTPTQTEKSFRIFLEGSAIKTQPYTALGCAGTAGADQAISAEGVNVTTLRFTQINGPVAPVGGSTAATSVTIDMTVTNGRAINVSGNLQCAPADNFCDQASFTTAVMQR